ncbi:hypothetical protein CBR_g55406 [Chara braunii]|uniref:Myb-like domain-containing protein n=1 Tax=Chara braunii TaxID=69332 RepID=A0A388K7Z9_CHABU|nr:hypothetical protein CBR_g55406 [Chara braunii]|eukprot:GBG66063.1 hypothetical protein CBR_g55406 [Chara braunii]
MRSTTCPPPTSVATRNRFSSTRVDDPAATCIRGSDDGRGAGDQPAWQQRSYMLLLRRYSIGSRTAEMEVFEVHSSQQSAQYQGLHSVSPSTHLSMLSQDADKFGVPPTFPAAVGQLPARWNDPPGLRDVRSGPVPFYHARDDHGGVAGSGSLSGVVYSQPTPTHMPMHGGSMTGAGSFTTALCGEYEELFSGGLPKRMSVDDLSGPQRSYGVTSNQQWNGGVYSHGQNDFSTRGAQTGNGQGTLPQGGMPRHGQLHATTGADVDNGSGVLEGQVCSHAAPQQVTVEVGSSESVDRLRGGLPPTSRGDGRGRGEGRQGTSDNNGQSARPRQPRRGGRGRGGCTPPPPACPAEASGSGKDVGGQESNDNQAPVNEGMRKGKTPAKKIVPWTLEECLALAKWQREDNTIKADVSVRHKCMKKGERQEWVSERMKEEGMMRSAEDNRKIWFNLGQKLKLLVDKVGRSGHQSYWDMTKEEREAEGLYATFDQRLWQAMECVLQRPSGTCDEAMNSDTMGGGEARGTGGGSGEQARSDRGGSDTRGSRSKFRRTSGNRVHVGDDPSSVSSVGAAMAESTRVYVDGLDRAATTIAQANKEGATIVARSIGKMTNQIGAVASAMSERERCAAAPGWCDGCPMKHEIVGGKTVVVQETKVDRRCHPRGRMDFSPDTVDLHSRVYYVLVEGTLAMKIDGGFGYDKEGNLVDVILNVKKLSEVVPDYWRLPERDVVDDIFRYLMSAIADEHMAALRGNAFYVAHMQPPLRGRQYSHDAVQSWCPEDDLKVARRRW